MADVFDQTVDRTKPSKQAGGKAQSAPGGVDVWSQTVARPIPSQQGDQPGFWSGAGSALWSDIKSIPGSIYHAIADPDPLTDPSVPDAEKNRLVAQMQADAAAKNAARTQTQGWPYSLASTAGEMMGVNVPGMEQSAQQGDVGGVLGHAAAVPLTIAATKGLSEVPFGRLARTAGTTALNAAAETPVIRRITPKAIMQNWRNTAPSAVPPAPELVSPSRTLPGMNPPEVTGRPTPGPIQGPGRGLMLPGEIEKALPEIPPSRVSTTPPKSSPAVQSKSARLSQLRSIAQQPGTGVSAPEPSGPPLRIAGQDVPASTNLEPALQKSLQPMVKGKIMQFLRKEGPGSTVGMDRLMESPGLKGYSREQVLDAATKLRDEGKIWHEQTGGGAHPINYTLALKKR